MEDSVDLKSYLKFVDEINNSQNPEILFSNNNISIIDEKEMSSSLDISIYNILNENEYPYMHYMCPKCHNFPLIQYINEREIYYTCGCIKKKQMKIKELFDNENKYFLIEKSSSKSSTRASSFSSGEALVTENSKEYKSKNNKNSIGFYCSKHNSKKFRYFCTTCKVNLCKECIEFHLGKEHNRIVFDFVTHKDTKPKIIKINEIINSHLKKKENFESIEKGFDLDDCNDKINNETIKLEVIDESTIEKVPINYMEYFIKLIYIILSDYNKYPNNSHLLNIRNIYFILTEMFPDKKPDKEQIKNSFRKFLSKKIN